MGSSMPPFAFPLQRCKGKLQLNFQEYFLLAGPLGLPNCTSGQGCCGPWGCLPGGRGSPVPRAAQIGLDKNTQAIIFALSGEEAPGVCASPLRDHAGRFKPSVKPMVLDPREESLGKFNLRFVRLAVSFRGLSGMELGERPAFCYRLFPLQPLHLSKLD